MKFILYIDPTGLERLAKGEPPQYWDFSIRPEGQLPLGGNRPLGEPIEVTLPTRTEAAALVLGALEEELKAFQANAVSTVVAYRERMSKLMAIDWAESRQENAK